MWLMYVTSLITSMLLVNEHKITDFPLKQWLHDHATMLRYTYTASLVPYLGPVL
jgi:hypothetical protein